MSAKNLVIAVFLLAPLVVLGINSSNKQITSPTEIELRPNARTDSYGVLRVKNGDSLQLETSAASADTISLSAPSGLAASYSLVLPLTDGTLDQVLKTDGSGNLDWVTKSSFDFVASNDNRLVRTDTVSGNQVQQSGITLDDSDEISGVAGLTVDNIDIDGNTITSTGNLIVTASPDTISMNSDTDVNAFFQVVNTDLGSHPCPSMTEAQRDAIASPTVGDCVTNTDTNKLNNYDGTAWVEIGSGGGSGGLLESNTMTDGGFESGVTDLTQATGSCAVSTSGVRDGFGDQLAQCSLSAEAADISYVYTDANVTAGDQGYVKCWVKSSITDLEFCSLNGNAEQQCLTYVGGPGGIDTWEEMSLTVPLSGTNDGFKLKSGSTTDTFELDNCYAGVIPTNTIQKRATYDLQTYRANVAQNALTDGTGGIEFATPLSTTFDIEGDDVLSITDDSGNTLTYWTCLLEKCEVDMSWSAVVNTTGNYAQIEIFTDNTFGTQKDPIARGNAIYTDPQRAFVSAHFTLDKNEVFYLSSTSSVFSTAGETVRVHIKASSTSNAQTIGASQDRFIVVATDNGGESITGGTTDIDFTTEVVDLGNHWDGDQYTVSKSGTYCFSGAVNSGTVSKVIDLYIDGTRTKTLSDNISTSIHNFSGCHKLNKDEVASIRSSANITTSSSTIFHHITVQYVPDNEQILAGLTDVTKTPGSGASQSVFVSASIDASEVITEDDSSFLSSCTNADPSVCTPAAGFFSSTATDPKCWAEPTSAGTIADVTADTDTSITIDRTDASTPFKLFCHGFQ